MFRGQETVLCPLPSWGSLSAGVCNVLLIVINVLRGQSRSASHDPATNCPCKNVRETHAGKGSYSNFTLLHINTATCGRCFCHPTRQGCPDTSLHPRSMRKAYMCLQATVSITLHSPCAGLCKTIPEHLRISWDAQFVKTLQISGQVNLLNICVAYDCVAIKGNIVVL